MDSVADLVEPIKVKVRARPADYKAGEAIAKAGGVVLNELNPIKATATVIAPGYRAPQHTHLASDPQTGLQWSCTCSDDPKLFCKHLVATALVAWAKSPKRRI
mgnify:CR=1 FL=1